jgi:phosphonate transport system ATP-binding protein
MLKLDGVSVTYPGEIRALRPTSLSFHAGQFTVLLGPSGAGKSTLLRCLNGLVAPTGGRVVAEALGDIGGGRALREHRRRTGMIFQQHQLIGRLSALRNVLTGRLGYHGQLRSLLPLPRADRLIALECLERVGLLDRALDRVDTLSGGMQQRVGIARALAQRPRLILADEPVSSLDPTTAVKVLELLRSICKADGIAAIVSLHQVELALEAADRIVGIAHGAVVFDGAAASFNAAHYRQIYEKALPVREPVGRPAPSRRPILATREVSP